MNLRCAASCFVYLRWKGFPTLTVVVNRFWAIVAILVFFMTLLLNGEGKVTLRDGACPSTTVDKSPKILTNQLLLPVGNPYVLRLQLLRLLTLYFNALYLRTPSKVRDASSRKALSKEMYGGFTFLLQSIFFIYVIFQMQEFEVVREFLGHGGYAQVLAMGIYTVLIVRQRSSHIRTTYAPSQCLDGVNCHSGRRGCGMGEGFET